MTQHRTDVSACVWWGDFRREHGRTTMLVLLLIVVVIGLLLFYFYNNNQREKHIPQATKQYEEGTVTKADTFVSELALTPREEKVDSPSVSVPIRINLLEKPEAKKKKSSSKAMGVAYLPMARKGEISSPARLAQRIRESLNTNSSGNKIVQGANATPKDFLKAIQNAGGTVDGVGALPEYLESLIERDMPQSELLLSRMKLARAKSGAKMYTLDIEKGYAREASNGERGWYDANTNLLILAGDCLNSPLPTKKEPRKVIVVPEVPQPTVIDCCKVPEITPVPPAPIPIVKKVIGIPDAEQPVVHGCVNPTNERKGC